MTITAARLEERGASQDQIAAFRRIWGDGPAPMTVEAALEHAQVFNWVCAAGMFLAAPARSEFWRATAPALARLRHAEIKAIEEFSRAEASAFTGYWNAAAPSMDDFIRAQESMFADFNRVNANAWAEYKRSAARAFATLYIAQEAAS